MRKFIGVVMLLCVLMCSAFESACAASRPRKYPAEGVENDRLNIREKPTTKSRILDALENGAHVTVNGEAKSPNGSLWYYIYDSASGVSGYVSAKFIGFPGSERRNRRE